MESLSLLESLCPYWNRYEEAKISDRCFGVSNSPSVFGSYPEVRIGDISGVYSAEQTFFLTSVGESAGAPVFGDDGRLIGMNVIRMVDGQPTGFLAVLSARSISEMANFAR